MEDENEHEKKHSTYPEYSSLVLLIILPGSFATLITIETFLNFTSIERDNNYYISVVSILLPSMSRMH